MSMADRDGWIWYDGKMVPWRDATTHVLTHTLHYGMGVFEGVRCYKTDEGPAIFRLRDHTDRLFRSAHIFGMKIPFTARTRSTRRSLPACATTSSTPATSGRSRSTDRTPWASPPSRIRCASRSPPGRGAPTSAPRRLEKRHPREDLVVHAPPSQHHHVQRQGRRQLHGVDPRQPGSACTMATRRRCCSIRRASSARVRARTCSSSATASCTRPTCPAVRSTASPATRSSPSPRELGIAGDRAAHHPRRGLHRRRGVLHRHGGRGHADPRTRQPRHRRRQARPRHHQTADAVLRHGERPQSVEESLAAHGMSATPARDATPVEVGALPTCRCSVPIRPCRCGRRTRGSSSTSPTTGEAMCPYCGTRYMLKGGPRPGGH